MACEPFGPSWRKTAKVTYTFRAAPLIRTWQWVIRWDLQKKVGKKIKKDARQASQIKWKLRYRWWFVNFRRFLDSHRLCGHDPLCSDNDVQGLTTYLPARLRCGGLSHVTNETIMHIEDLFFSEYQTTELCQDITTSPKNCGLGLVPCPALSQWCSNQRGTSRDFRELRLLLMMMIVQHFLISNTIGPSDKLHPPPSSQRVTKPCAVDPWAQQWPRTPPPLPPSSSTRD